VRAKAGEGKQGSQQPAQAQLQTSNEPAQQRQLPSTHRLSFWDFFLAASGFLYVLASLRMRGRGGQFGADRMTVFMLQIPLFVIIVALLWALRARLTQVELYFQGGLCLLSYSLSLLAKIVWNSPEYERLLNLFRFGESPNIFSSLAGSHQESLESIPSAKEQEFLEARLQEVFKRTHNKQDGLHLIEVRKLLGKHAQALEVVDALLASEPNDVDLLLTKADLSRAAGDERAYRKISERADEVQEKVAFEQNLGKNFKVVSWEMRDLDFFGAFKWQIQPQVSVLLGRNGYGKSHLLRALVATLQKEKILADKFFENSRSSPLIRVEVDKDGKRECNARSRQLYEEPSAGKIPVLAIPDMRYVNKAGETLGQTRDEMTDLRSQSAWHFLREQPYEGMIMKLLYGMCLDYYENQKLGFGLPVFRLMEDTVSKLTGAKFKFDQIRRREDKFELFVLTEGNDRPLPLQKASQGTLSVLSMVGLVYRHLRVIHQHAEEKDITSQPGIVIIDEIDAHLHPVWQQKILQLFRTTFPNVQFIITAHSPLVVAGCKKFEVAVLRKESDGFQVDVLPRHFIGATADEMYRNVFDTEDKDATYSRLNTLSKAELDEKIGKLEQKTSRSELEEKQLADLKLDQFYLREFEEVKAARRKTERFQTDRQVFELELSSLRGELSSTKKQLARYESVDEEAQWKGIIEAANQLTQMDTQTRSLLEAIAAVLVQRGQVKETVQVMEALLHLDPSNLDYLKILIGQYQSLEQFDKASNTVKAALRLAPEDKDLQEVQSRLEQLSLAIKESRQP